MLYCIMLYCYNVYKKHQQCVAMRECFFLKNMSIVMLTYCDG